MKKGMMETGELILVVIMVMILLVAGLVAYSFFSGQSYEENKRQTESLDAVRLAQKTSSFPEISCGGTETGCVDAYRMNYVNASLEPESERYNYYASRFGNSLVQVREVYPEDKTWTLWNNTPESAGSATPLRIPVTIHKPRARENGFGYMAVVSYS